MKITGLPNKSASRKNNDNKPVIEKNKSNCKIVEFSVSGGNIKLTNKLKNLEKLFKSWKMPKSKNLSKSGN